MKIEIKDVAEGGYGLPANDNLYFQFENDNELILDKKSALEIAHTLFDSLDLLEDDMLCLFYQAEDILNASESDENVSKNDFDTSDI